MPISSPRLVSCSARIEESVVSHVSGTTYVIAVKNHCGSPRRELEIFTTADIENAQSGPLFYNLVPTKIEILDQVFRFVSSIVLSTEEELAAGNNPIIRLYWNQIAGRQTGNNPIVQIDYDLTANIAVSSTSNLSFEGLDPFILDARTTDAPNRLYMLYISESGAQSLRVSNDLGVTWSTGCSFDSNVKYVEGFIRDPLDQKVLIRAMQMQSSQEVINPQGDAYINDFTTQGTTTSLLQRIYPFIGRRRQKRVSSSGTNLQRFREIKPIVIKSGITRNDPC